MKLLTNDVTVETSDTFKEHKFQIADEGFIFELLRSKIYSDPIGSICREVMCNARDSMREAGKSHIPIEISLPNNLNPMLSIKDSGVGISPDRMENIFVKYASSTKRNDNYQTGAFGIGAKTPFAYSDTFSIITIFDNTKYIYSAFIDESKVGKIALLCSEYTDEINGTEIIIPIKPYDFNTFRQNCIKYSRFWDVKPIFINESILYNNIKYLFSKNNWDIIEKTRTNYYENKISAIIDGIKYEIDGSKLSDQSFLNNLYCPVHLKFNNGELAVSANRENLYYNDFTLNALNDRVKSFKVEFFNHIKELIENSNSYIEALQNASRYSSLYGQVISTFTWNDIVIPRDGKLFYGSEASFYYFNQINFKPYISTMYYIGTDKLQDAKFVYIDDAIYNNNDIIKLKKIFSKSQLESCFIFSKSTYEKIKELPYVKYLNFTDKTDTLILSKERKAFSKINVFKMSSNDIYLSSQKDIDNCFKIKIVCPFDTNFNNKKYPLINNSPTSIDTIMKIVDYTTHDIFCIKSQNFLPKILDDKFEEYITLDDYYKTLFALANKQQYVNYNEICNAKGSGYYAIKNFIFNFGKMMNIPELKEVINILKSDNTYNSIYSSIMSLKSYFSELDEYMPNPTINIEEITNTIYNKYPMIKFISDRYYVDSDLDKQIIKYIEIMNEIHTN